MNIVHQAARRPERLEALDKVAKPLAGAVGRAVGRAWCATCSAAPTWGIPRPRC
jgi:cytochrome c5